MRSRIIDNAVRLAANVSHVVERQDRCGYRGFLTVAKGHSSLISVRRARPLYSR
jgi:hypothetical protein